MVAGARSTKSLAGLSGVTAVDLDLSAPDGPARLVEIAVRQHGRLDVLVNNVGAVRLRLEGFLGTSDAEFEWAMQINFFTALRATRAAIVQMLTQGGGAIVNVASVNAFFQPDGGTVDYGAAKAALVNLTKGFIAGIPDRAAFESMTVISPGPVSTDLWFGEKWSRANGRESQIRVSTPSTARDNIVASIGGFATGRFTTPEEVATLVVMLASARTGNVTGQNYVIDGGLIKTLWNVVDEAGERPACQFRPCSAASKIELAQAMAGACSECKPRAFFAAPHGCLQSPSHSAAKSRRCADAFRFRAVTR